MSKFICQSCPERCSLFCAQNASEIPTRCQFVGKANWERVVEDKPPVYYTLPPAPAAETEIDYKKAFEVLQREVGTFGWRKCANCPKNKCTLGEAWACKDKQINNIVEKCTKGGE